MEITDIRIRKVETEGKLKAYVTLTFDRCFVVHNLKIISGQAGTFVAMPSRKTKQGEYKDIAHPINSDFRNILQSKILEEYLKLDEGEEDRREEADPEPEPEAKPEPEPEAEPEPKPEAEPEPKPEAEGQS
jgi:stage V sporulation protein G